MSDLPPRTEVVESFAELVDRWTTDVGGHAKQVAHEIDSGTFGLDAAARAAAKCGALSLTGWVRLVEFMGASATSTERILTKTLSSGKGVSFQERFLALAGPLTSGWGDTIPPGRCSFSPNRLHANETTFDLVVTIQQDPAGTYDGTVLVTVPGVPGNVDEIPVWLIVG